MKFMLMDKEGRPMKQALVNKVLDAIGHERLADVPLFQEGVLMPTIEILENEYDSIIDKITKTLGVPPEMSIECKGLHFDRIPDEVMISYRKEF